MPTATTRSRRTFHRAVLRRAVLLLTALALAVPTALVVAAPAEARTGSKLKVSGPKKATTAKKLTFRGNVRSANKRRVVKVHVRNPSTAKKKWKLVRTKRTTRAGAFTVKVGSGKKAGKRVVRFTAPRTKKFKRARVKRVVQVRATTPPRPEPDTSPLQLVWSTTDVTAGDGATFTASGTVRAAAETVTSDNLSYAGWPVVLQRKHTDGWKQVSRATTAADGTFTVNGSAHWLHSLPYRVRVTPPGTNAVLESDHRTLSALPAWTPGGNASAWKLLKASDGTTTYRLRWNPCGPAIRYRVNLGQAKAGQTLADVKRAVAETSLATGLTFDYRGTTKAHAFAGPNQTPARPADADLLISWTKNKQSEGVPFGQYSSTVGLGGLGATGALLSTDARGEVIPADRGNVAMRANWNWQGNRDAAYGVLLHELGHAVGLDHSADDRQVMYYSWMPWTPERWGAGDLSGLNRMGLADGCIRTPGASTAQSRAFAVPDDEQDTEQGDTHGHTLEVARP